MCSNVIELPLSEHWGPEVKLAKKYGIKNLTDYDTLEEVKDKGQEMIGSRLVITVKETPDGQKQQCKSRLVAWGFHESSKPQSNNPTASKISFKLFLLKLLLAAIAINNFLDWLLFI